MRRESFAALHDPAIPLLAPKPAADQPADIVVGKSAALALPVQNAQDPEPKPLPRDAGKCCIDTGKAGVQRRYDGVQYVRVPAKAGAAVQFQRAAMGQHQAELAGGLPG
jgi:hypothetical protein